MEYNEKNEQTTPTIMMVLEQITVRQNEQVQAMADLRSAVERVVKRQDEADHMSSEEFGQQVVQQIMDVMPTIQAQAMKQAKRRPGK